LQTFGPNKAFFGRRSTKVGITIAEGVEFDTIAREVSPSMLLSIFVFIVWNEIVSHCIVQWRCKWSGDDDKKSLVEVQKALESILPDVKKVDGVKSVERIVCGGCLDFKVITSLPAEKFGEWEAKEFAPEAAFLEKLKGINGVSLVETQTFTVRLCFLALWFGWENELFS
jgi:hypothetical protein